MPSGFPVVITASGGVPVINVAEKAPLATVAANGRGLRITLVAKNGAPMIVQGAP